TFAGDIVRTNRRWTAFVAGIRGRCVLPAQPPRRARQVMSASLDACGEGGSNTENDRPQAGQFVVNMLIKMRMLIRTRHEGNHWERDISRHRVRIGDVHTDGRLLEWGTEEGEDL